MALLHKALKLWRKAMIIPLNLLGYSLWAFAAFSSCGPSSLQKPQLRSYLQPTSDTCDNPDASVNCCFINMPETLSSVMTIADATEPGDRLIITGTIFKRDGKTPYPHLVLYAYQTDATGRYTKNGTETGVQKWHGRLHGWCKTDKNGRYEIRSIRPARYPDNSMPAHIHAAVKPDGGQPFYITDFVFRDDSLVNQKYLASLFTNTGGTGVVTVVKDAKGVWIGERNVTLKN
jgi:protocatechuate 3,4-dioxygenase beta subunit